MDSLNLRSHDLLIGQSSDTPSFPSDSGPSSKPMSTIMERPIFVSLQEKKELVPGVKQSRSRGSGSNHTYTVKFYLVDSKGLLHHAATGIDGGDSHYEYTNNIGFPPLQCHNKSEVKVWADQIMRDSQAGSGYHTDIVHDEVPLNPSLISLPQFVSYSETKDELPDGRHRIQWFLLDTAGHNHLAVVGIEKETRDGHYIYSTENIFEKAAPLQAHNQEEVKKWLSWIIGPRTDPLTPHFFSSYRSKTRSKSRSKKKSQISHLKSRGRGRPPRSGGFGAFSGGTSKKGRGNYRAYDLDFDAHNVTAAELRKWLEEEVRRREAKKSTALAFMDESIPVLEDEIIERCFKVLESSWPVISSSGAIDDETLFATIGALREIAHVRPSLRIAKDEAKVALLRNYMLTGPDVTKQAAQRILSGWLISMTNHIEVMMDESYVEDPRPTLEKIIEDALAFGPMVTNITKRELEPWESEVMPPPQFNEYPTMQSIPRPTTMDGDIFDTSRVTTEVQKSSKKEGPTDSCVTFQSAPSSTLVEAGVSGVQDFGDSAILPPFQQKMAKEGIEY